MKKLSLFLTLLTLTLIIVISISTVSAAKWTDVPDNAWYTSAVTKANELGIMNGTSSTTFAPLKNLTRAEYVAILFRLSGGEEGLEFSFTDVPSNAWYRQYVGWAEKSGVITGYGNAQTFGGNELITREQLMLMTSRYMSYEWVSFDDSDKAVNFNDSDKISSWAADGVEITRRAGLITGDANGNFNPQAPATRAEIATIVVRYIEALPNANDPMHAKLEKISELVECLNGKPVVHFGKWLDARQNKADVLGEQLLPQMGLDTDTYKMYMSDYRFESFKKTYQEAVYSGEISDGEAKLIPTQLTIKNLKTNEETELKTVLINAVYNKIVIDPSTYNLDIDETLLNSICKTAVHSVGDVSRLASAFRKAEAGEKLNVVYVGGSITAGGGADIYGNWVSGVTDWLQKQFPDSEINGFNAGCGGTGSKYGIIRLQNQVLNHDPDIVFVEFSANDQGSQSFKESFEALVRTCLTYDEDTAVVIVLVANKSRENGLVEARKNHFELAEHYNLPIVDIHAGVHVGVDAGTYTFDEFTHDGGHPTTWGHMLMSEIVENFLSVVRSEIKVSSADKLVIGKLPAMLHDDTYMGYKTIDILNTNGLITEGSWKVTSTADGTEVPYTTMTVIYDAWTCNVIDSTPLSFNFTGSEMYMIMNNPECITVTITDNVNTYVFDNPAKDETPVFSGLPNKEYNVTITMKRFDESADPGEPNTPFIYAIVYR